ncbi:MAG: glycosyltransferase family 2 protein [Actinomycetia bacterium]|nr:glycosyltransferase family 2 protein [Actinomycetes bacterium]
MERAPTPAASLVIPAHNESTVLSRTLDGVLAQDVVAPLDVIVVPNGCSDDTAAVAAHFVERAREQGWELRVSELSEGSKTAALNHGDSLAHSDTRIYMDADVSISANTVSAVLDALDREGIHFAAPAMVPVPPESPLVRAYIDVWSQMPYVKQGGPGRGLYAVSPEGRSRWTEFPHITADDTFVRLHFDRSEALIAEEAEVEVRFASSISELIAVRGRKFRGLDELRARYPSLMEQDEPRGRVAVRTIVDNPELWLRAPVFIAVYALGKLQLRRARRRGDDSWARADSSR